MSNRYWWMDEEEDGEMLTNRKQTYDLGDLMKAYFDFDPSPDGSPYFYCKAKWRELNEKLPQEVGPEGFTYPHAYFNAEKQCDVRGENGMTETMSQADFMSIRPILKRIAESDRDVCEA